MNFCKKNSEDYRPKAILPRHNLGVDDDSNHTAARNEPPTRPTSAMSEDFKPHGQDAFRKISLFIHICAVPIIYLKYISNNLKPKTFKQGTSVLAYYVQQSIGKLNSEKEISTFSAQKHKTAL